MTVDNVFSNTDEPMINLAKCLRHVELCCVS